MWLGFLIGLAVGFMLATVACFLDQYFDEEGC